MDMHEQSSGLRRVIWVAVTVCLLVAMAPWMSGGQEPVALLIGGFALLLGVLLIWRQRMVRKMGRAPLAISFWVLMGWAALSWGWSVNNFSTGMWISHWLMAGVAFWLAYVVAETEDGRAWLWRGYLISAGVFGIVAVTMYLTSSYERLTGTFYWANPAAAYLIPAVLLVVDRVRRTTGRMSWVWVMAAGAFLACFWLADSRAAGLVLVMVMLGYLLLVNTNKRFWIKFLIILGIGFGLSMVLVYVGTITVRREAKAVPGARIVETVKGESTSMVDRINYLKSAGEIWFDYPLMGTGAGTYGDVHARYQQRVVSASANAHNLYVQTLAELGLIGAVALAAVVWWLLVGLVRGITVAPETLPGVMGVVGLLIHFGMDIDATYPALLLLVAVLAGTIWRRWWGMEQRVRPRWWSLAVMGVVMVLVVGWYQSSVWAQHGAVAREDGEYEEAAEDYALSARGFMYDPDFVNAEGILRYTLATEGQSGQVDGAMELAQRAQKMDRYDGQHYQLEGRVWALKGDEDLAQAAFRQALERDGYNHPDYAGDLAASLMRVGDKAEAVRVARAMLDQYSDEVVRNRSMDESVRPALADLAALIGNVAWSEGRRDEALEMARRAVAYYPEGLRGRALLRQVERE